VVNPVCTDFDKSQSAFFSSPISELCDPVSLRFVRFPFAFIHLRVCERPQGTPLQRPDESRSRFSSSSRLGVFAFKTQPSFAFHPRDLRATTQQMNLAGVRGVHHVAGE
jgi:hypothetical protein